DESKRPHPDGRIQKEGVVRKRLDVRRTENVLGQNAKERPADRRDKSRVWLVELDDKRIVIRRPETSDVSRRAAAIIGDADDMVELGAVGAARSRVRQHLVREKHVSGRKRLAVAPLQPWSEIEGEGARVR